MNERWWADRKTRTYQIDPSNPARKKTVFDLSWEDLYHNPGEVITTLNAYGRPVMLINNDNSIYLRGNGASSSGDQPFLDKMDLTTGKSTRVWKSEAPHFEFVVNVTDSKKRDLHHFT